ncbi:MAG TPA: ABC transporter permease [Anaerolineales bacterium]|jgi:lipopolysaccharide transport system permease protein|nr:ABC transporter permease [Anaerolineales bacterium]
MENIPASSPISLPPSEAHLSIEPPRGWAALELRELWLYRELLFFLAWRDIKLRYKQTALGAAWAILQPLLTMVIFSVIFGQLAKLPSDGIPYPIFTYAALLPWQLFSFALTNSSNSLINSQNLISKVYFPRLIIPLASTLAGLMDFAIAFLVLLGLMVYYHITPTMAILYLPLFLILALLSALAVGVWLSALSVEYRDVRYIVPFLTQFWMYATPIAYASSLIPENWRLLYGLNPMTGVVEGFRWALLGIQTSGGSMILVSAAVVVVMFISGLYYFRRMENNFADVI